MGYLVACGTLSLMFGLLLVASPGLLGVLGGFCNHLLFYLDKKLWPIRFLVGAILIVVGAWKLYVIMDYELWQVWHLHVTWFVSILFGIFFLAFPVFLKRFSDFSDLVILSTDKVVMGARKLVGIVLIIVSVYIFYGAYYIR